jgi:hypothetical protein
MPPIMLIPTILKLFLRNLNIAAITVAAKIPPAKLVQNCIGFKAPFITEPRVVLKNAIVIASNGPNISNPSTETILAKPILIPGINENIGGSKKFKTMPNAIRADMYVNFLRLVGC